MLKLSKTQISLICTLSLLILGQLGFVCYKNYTKQTLPQTLEEKEIAHAGTGKAFGLIDLQEKHIHVSSVKELREVFTEHNYSLKQAKSEGRVPRLFLAKLPKDMKHQRLSSNSAFIKVLLPHILKVNEQILADRGRLLMMREQQKRGHRLTHSEKIWLSHLASDYRCKSSKIESLLMRVDIVPPSLALAQATLETGGGRSHAALTKNSPFGHMATKTKVRAFESLMHSVEAYISNLNCHKAYEQFRVTRAALRARNQQICGHRLASCLTKYSVRGAAYTRDVQKLIDARDLRRYDAADIRLKT